MKMESIFEVQQKLKAERGLQKIVANKNANYHRDGTKSYIYLMNRFGFEPTKPGPYLYTTRVAQRGLSNGSLPLGGRMHMRKQLTEKKTAPDGSVSLGDVTAEDQQNDSMYLCEVQIGNPPQTVQLDFDTGSSDLWVFSPQLSRQQRGSHHIFDPSKSKTWKPSQAGTWEIIYGDRSSASGTVGYDSLILGGLEIKNQAIEVASHLSPQFAEGTGDGLLGLAFPAINTVLLNGQHHPVGTPVANMIDDELIPKNAELFTSAFYSGRDSNKRSFYTFGWIDQDLVQASQQDIHWTPVDSSQGFWMVPSTSVTINGEKMSLSENTAIVDTGTSLALVSDEVCEAFYDQIDGATYSPRYQGYIVPTDIDAEGLPDISIAIGNQEFTIQKEDFIFAPVDRKHSYGAIQSRGRNDFDILGDTFLKSIYAIWDQGNRRFGCVPKIEKGASSTS